MCFFGAKSATHPLEITHLNRQRCFADTAISQHHQPVQRHFSVRHDEG
jgi:hypothetical protein